MNLPLRAARVIAYLREVADGDVATVTREQIAEGAELGQSTVRLAVQDLVQARLVEVEPTAGRSANRYRLRTVNPSTDPSQPVANPSANPSEGNGLNPSVTGLPSRARPIHLNPREEPGLPTAAPVAGDASPPASPPASESDGLPDGSAPDGLPVEVGQAVVGWAVDEQRRLGKPPLDGALLAKLGSMAKRMSAGGVAAPELKLAVEHLVARDMTALDAAHRQALAAMTTHAPTAERSALRELAEASRGARDPRSFDPHREDELVEAWAFLVATWYREPLPSEEERAAWHAGLRVFPMDCILWALNAIARRGDRFRPTWGQVHAVAAPKFKDAVVQWRADAQAERMKQNTEGEA